jgi:hypothetical protein
VLGSEPRSHDALIEREQNNPYEDSHPSGFAVVKVAITGS